MNIYKTLALVSCSALALAGCGADDVASPGTGGNVTINNTATTPTPTPTPPATPAGVTPAAGCPTIADPQGLTDSGVITGPTGTWRVCTLPSRINRSITLAKVPGLLYQMSGRVDVGTDGGFTASPSDSNVTLTIEPGVILFAGTGVTWLAVNRGNRINAVGTATRPIIFTSRDNVLGLANNDSQSQWGGVVLMGRARTTDCATGSVGAGTCERQTEGAADPALYGGANDADNSGTMQYVQFRYSGYTLSANSELQALTPSGVGSGTTLSHIMVYNSSDDGIEIFGGQVNLRYYVGVNSDDDTLDVDTGARVNTQFGLILQRPGANDAFLEIDSNGRETDTPRTSLTVANYTMVQPNVNPSNEAQNQASIMLRGNSDNTWINNVIISPNNECLRMNGSGAAPVTLVARSTVMQCNTARYLGTGTYTPAVTGGWFGPGANNNSDTHVSTLTGGFINGPNETARTATNPATFNAFFTPTTYVGAVRDAADTWYAGWTCNSATANFGPTSGSCASLPTN